MTFFAARFAAFLVKFATYTKSPSLTNALVRFFQATDGPGNRKAYLPSRKVKRKGKAGCFHSGIFGWRHESDDSFENTLQPRCSICLQAHYIRPNRDVAKTALKDVLSMAAQFFDGSLEGIFVGDASGSASSKQPWKVDVDQLPASNSTCACKSITESSSPKIEKTHPAQ